MIRISLSVERMPFPGSRRSAFTLVEMLTAVAVLLILGLVLVGITSQAAKLWTQGEGQIQYQERARVALDFIGKELKHAVLATNGNNSSLEFVVNPSSVSATYSYPNSIFWQAPIATDSSAGDLAEVGYFVQWNGTQANLCRFFVNPSDTNGNYLIYQLPYTQPEQWVTDSVIAKVAPATQASQYQGLFLNNVLSFWVAALNVDGTAYGGDSRAPAIINATPQHLLPAQVEISLVFLDASSAARITTSMAAAIKSLSTSTASAQLFVKQLPVAIRSGARVATLLVNLDNYK
jgi:prepilin-type N-terminal cleavage/methylation domain-containing protein